MGTLDSSARLPERTAIKDARAESTRRQRRFAAFRRYSVVHFLAALIVLLLTMPFVEQLHNGEFIEAALITIVLLSGVIAVGGRRHSIAFGCVLVSPALVGTWMDHLFPDVIPRELVLLAAMAFATYVVWHLLGYILRSTWVNFEILCTALATYLMLGALWAMAYELVSLLIDGSFAQNDIPIQSGTMTSFQALYFSFCTMTTADYGDITPVANIARMLAIAQSTTGVFYVTVLIARLVSLYSTGEAARKAVEPELNGENDDKDARNAANNT